MRGAQRLPASLSFLARVSEVRSAHRIIHLRIPVRVLSRNQLQLIPGTSFRAQARVIPTRERKVAALFILERGLHVTRASNLLQRETFKIRQRFSHRSERIAGDSGTLIPGLVLGDTSRESDEFVSHMRRVGLTHLTAVSGENFAIIAATLLWLSQWFIRRQKLRILLTAVVLIAFIFLVRPSPSVLRASVMTGVVLLSKVKGSRADPLASLGFAIGILVLLDPFQALDAGFALSVAATAGILVLSPQVSGFIQLHGIKEGIADFLAIPLSATALCAPIIIAISGQLSLLSIPVNLLVSMVVAPITIGGFIAALLPWGNLSHLILVAVNPCAHWISWIAREGAQFPVLLFPRNLLGIAFVLAGIFFIAKRRWKLFSVELLIVALIFFTQSLAWPGKNWQVVNCDVGQGDALVINLGKRQAIVIDTGPDPDLMQTCLKDLGITKIPLLVLTHFHADHVGGLVGVMKSAQVESVWVSRMNEPAHEYEQVMKEIGNLPISIVHQGEQIRFTSDFGVGQIEVMWPSDQIVDFDSLPGDGSAINNSSIALLIRVGAITLFAAGDIEPPAQSAIVEARGLSDVGILKVAHHGSANQDARLYTELHPDIALISVGAGNSYGHPADSTVQGLRGIGARVMRTDIDGAISIDASLRIRTNKKAWWKISWG